jgi:LDH2 family malate/lactate/ureidoglycolate dehydrogenase
VPAIVCMEQLVPFIRKLCGASGMTEEDAAAVADIYSRSTLRGVGHHDVNDLPGRLRLIRDGQMNPRPAISRLSGFGAVESYDGDNGPGELVCSFAMRRAEQLASDHGIGLCTVRNSNHFLAAAPYTEQAAEKGDLGLMLTRTKPVMGGPDGGPAVIGNNPFGFAAPSGHGFPLSLDIAVAYASYGRLKELEAAGQPIPAHWGRNARGEPTSDPGEVQNGGIVMPIGAHKGFGIALLIELLTSIIGEGLLVDEPPAQADDTGSSIKGVYTQTAIAIKIEALLPEDAFRARVSRMIEFIQSTNPDIRVPGERSYRQSRVIHNEGVILDAKLIDRLNEFAEQLGVEPLAPAGPEPCLIDTN